MKRPNLFLHATLGTILKLVTVFKGQRYIKKTKIKGPAIVLSNHTSFYDFMYTFSSIYPRRTTFVAARKMFHEDVLKTFMNLARAIPKSLMENDVSAVKNIFKILKKDGIISIFPEGQISNSGATMQFNEAISKLVKKSKVNVYLVKHLGAGLANPPWTKKTFRGKIYTEESLLISKEELNNLSVDEITEIIKKGLEFSPTKFGQTTNNRYKVNDITNLNNLFYLCQNCLHEGLDIKENNLHCPNCNTNYVYNDQGFINELGYDEFYYKQEKLVIEKIEKDKDFFIKDKCRLISIHNNIMQEVGSGEVSLNSNYYEYVGTINGEEVIKRFLTKNVSFLPSDIGRNIQIYDGDQVYQFELETSYLPTKFVLAGYHFYKKQQ